MPLVRTLPQTPDQNEPPPSGRAGGRRPRPVTPAGRAALDAALASGDLVREARAVLAEASAWRQEAVLVAHEDGVSIRRVAAGIGVTGGAVQRLVALARAARAAS